MRCSVIILEKEKQIYEKVDEERSLLLCYEGDGQTEEDVIFVENSQAFEGTIKEINSTSAVVEVDEGFPIRSSGDRVSVTLDEAAALAQVGDRVRVTYSGAVMESYPLQLGNQKSILTCICLLEIQRNGYGLKRLEQMEVTMCRFVKHLLH